MHETDPKKYITCKTRDRLSDFAVRKSGRVKLEKRTEIIKRENYLGDD